MTATHSCCRNVTPGSQPIAVILTKLSASEWRRVIVEVCGRGGSGRSGMAGGLAGLPYYAVVPAFTGNVLRAVLGAGAPPLRHHRGTIGEAVGQSRLGYFTGWRAQGRKQERTARGGHVCVPRRGAPDHRAVRQLLILPSPKGFDQMMLSAKTFEVGGVRRAALRMRDRVVEIRFGRGAVAPGKATRQIAAAHEIGQRLRRDVPALRRCVPGMLYGHERC